MNNFSIEEIFISSLSAFIYGVIFSVLLSIVRLLISTFYLVKKGTVSWGLQEIKKENILNCSNAIPRRSTSFGVFLTVLMFGLGFMLISYVFLDGCVRLYLLIFALLGLYASNNTLIKLTERLVLMAAVSVLSLAFVCVTRVNKLICKMLNSIKKAKNGFQKRK